MFTFDNTPRVAILLNASNGWARRLIKGFLSYANEVGPWQIWLRPDLPVCINGLPQGWHGHGVVTRTINKSLSNSLQESGASVVNVTTDCLENFSAPCVLSDDRIASRMAFEHYRQRGLRNLAMVSPRHRARSPKYSRYSAMPAKYEETFCEMVAEQGLFYSSHLFDDTRACHLSALTQWLIDLPKPVGILVWGQVIAMDVMNACVDAQILVPHDVSILCHNYDEVLSQASVLPLSGILVPSEQIGYHAAKKLHKLMQGETVAHEATYLSPLGVKAHLSTDTLAVNDPQLVKAIRYIRQHAFESIAMDDILREVSMARRSFERRFEKVFGCSPLEEIRRLRVKKARELLAETDRPMPDIAAACGYATYNYLSRVFKEATGQSPGRYRKSIRTRS